MQKNIKCCYQRPRAFRTDVLITGIGRRAIHVFCDTPNDNNDLTEHEWYWTLYAAAIAAAQLKWKHVKLVILQKSVIYIKNPAGHEIRLGDFYKIAEPDSFLNDDYYTPKGFWIKTP